MAFFLHFFQTLKLLKNKSNTNEIIRKDLLNKYFKLNNSVHTSDMIMITTFTLYHEGIMP